MEQAQKKLIDLEPTKLVVTARSGRLYFLTGERMARFIAKHKTLRMVNSVEYGWSTVESTKTVRCVLACVPVAAKVVA